MHTNVSRRRVLTAIGAGFTLPCALMAQSAWPTRSVKVVVPYPAGGAPDAFGRLMAEQLAAHFNQAFVVENKPGANGLIGARAVSQNAADNHALLYLNSQHVTLQALNPQFNILNEFKVISRLTSSPFICVVGAKSPYKTMAELNAAVAANPGKLTFGSAGIGSPAHMAVEYLEDKLPAFKALHIPYKGAVESVNAILSNQIDFSIMLLGTAIPQIQGGNLRALGVTSPKRLPVLPDVPSISEAIAPGYAFDAWAGLAMAAGTSDDVIAQLFKVSHVVAVSPQSREMSLRNGSLVSLSASSKEFADQIARDVQLEQTIVKKLGVT